MDHYKTVVMLGSGIVILSAIAAFTGIISSAGPGAYEYESIRGETVVIYGKGVYEHMSADLAPQGIAQDYVTLFLAVPLLILGMVWTGRGSLKGRFLLAGTLGYFLVSYLFYLVMGMYNFLFLVYVILTGLSFFACALTLLSFDAEALAERFSERTPVRFAGGFLIVNGVAIGVMWLGIVVPPLLEGTIIPPQAEHYTTLIVQGLDLSILLPLAVVSGVMFMRKRPLGYLLAPTYLVFLSILMTALIAKIIAMGVLGQNVMPAVIIIPVITIVSVSCAVLILRAIRNQS